MKCQQILVSIYTLGKERRQAGKKYVQLIPSCWKAEKNLIESLMVNYILKPEVIQEP